MRYPIMMLVFVTACSGFVRASEDHPAKKIVLIAGKKSHGPGTHEYLKDLRLLKHCLDTSPNIDRIRTELHVNGWPEDPRTLDDADTIVLFSDGADHNEQAHPFLVGDRISTIEKQMKRGCGLVVQHYVTIVPKAKAGDRFLEWVGGYFDYESGPPPRGWYSKITTTTTTPLPATPVHPVSRGLRPFKLTEEYYYNIRFRDNDPRLVPILTTPIPGEAAPHVVAWAVQRKDGGRGFATTCGHSHANFQLTEFRRMHLNAIVWSAGMEVPPGGVESALPDVAKPKQAESTKPINALIVTGGDHPGHKWRETTPALLEALWQDERFLVDVTHDPEMMTKTNLSSYGVILMHYCNWKRSGLSVAAKQKFREYLSGGGGLSIIHFANGAFHHSLPEAGQSDWPEYRKICRRVWDHSGGSGHDGFGRFRVEIATIEHPITKGMKSFETTDELYCRQRGELPIEVLAVARSKMTGRDEPMAWVNTYGKGRVFQTVLGHAPESIRGAGPAELIRRGSIWAARR